MFKQYKINNWDDSAEFVFVIDLPVALEKCKPWLEDAQLFLTEKNLIELLKQTCSTLAHVALWHQLNQYGISNIPSDHPELCLIPIRGTHGIQLISADVYEPEMYAEKKSDVAIWPEPLKAPEY